MFIGRQRYIDDLASLWRKPTSSLVACRGRRRIGKSRLIKEFARLTAERYIEISGLPPRRGMTNRAQLDAFAAGLARAVGGARRRFEDWSEAFAALEDKMKRLHARTGMSVRPVLVYVGELSGEVEGDGFFDAIIPAERLLQK